MAHHRVGVEAVGWASASDQVCLNCGDTVYFKRRPNPPESADTAIVRHPPWAKARRTRKRAPSGTGASAPTEPTTIEQPNPEDATDHDTLLTDKDGLYTTSDDVRRFMDDALRAWRSRTYRNKRAFDRERNRRLRVLADPEFWRSIAEMQQRLGWPACGIKKMRDVAAWHEALYENLAEALSDEPFHIFNRPVKRAIMSQARRDGIKTVTVPEGTPDMDEGKRICRAWPTLSPSLKADIIFVAEIARIGLDATLRRLDDILKGNEAMAPILPNDSRYKFRGKLSKGKAPLDPYLAVRIYRWWWQRQKTLVDIGREQGWPVYPNPEGGERCPLAAHYRDVGGKIIDAYDADSRPSLRVPTFDEGVSNGWFSVVQPTVIA